MSTASKTLTPQITVFRGWKYHGRHVWSPFVVKLETRLRFAGVPYSTEEGSLGKAPKGKIPYIEYAGTPGGGESTQMGDSALIIKALSERGVIPDINAALSPAARAQDMGLRALLEDKLCFYHVSDPPTRGRRPRISPARLLTGPPGGRPGSGGSRTTTSCATTCCMRCPTPSASWWVS